MYMGRGGGGLDVHAHRRKTWGGKFCMPQPPPHSPVPRPSRKLLSGCRMGRRWCTRPPRARSCCMERSEWTGTAPAASCATAATRSSPAPSLRRMPGGAAAGRNPPPPPLPHAEVILNRDRQARAVLNMRFKEQLCKARYCQACNHARP